MALTLVTGGARSGKSRFALALAARTAAPVTFVATAEAHDAEMTQRIAHHRAERPADWRTVEEPLDLEGAVAAVAPGDCLVVDCLSLWTANALVHGDPGRAARRAAALAGRRPGTTIAVTNEVGMGVVPATPLGRRYRDVLGRVNATWAGAADHALLIVAGRALVLSTPADVVEALAL